MTTVERDVAPFAGGPVAVIALFAMGLLVAVAARYGWHRDELYFLELGKHLGWGYVDEPPFTPLVARLANAVAPGNLVVLRLLPALATATTITLGALIARELGGAKKAQLAAAGAVAGGGFLLGVGHLLSTAVFDLTAWMAMLWLVARLLRTGDVRLWAAIGAVAGVSLWNKDLVALLGVSVLVGLVAERRWDLLRSRWLLAGVLLAGTIALPQIVWQAANGWPQLAMARALAHRLAVEDRVTLPAQLILIGLLLVGVLWRGTRWLQRDPSARRFRALLWAWPAAIVATFATAGRPYYALPLTTVVLIAGIVATEQRGPTRRLGWLVLASAVLSVPVSLPLLPVSTLGSTGFANVNPTVAETVGWPQLVDQLAGVVDRLPTVARAHVVLLAQSYGEAGAIDRFGPGRGLPHAFSPHNHYWFFRRPTDDAATVITVRWPLAVLARWFDSCTQVAMVDNGLGVDNEAQGQPIAICRGLRGSWRTIWPEMKFLA
jgi:4-amino-4-deoxy-L-arabinose transferase-like glycosyltransferase